MMMGLYYPKKNMPETSKWAMAAKPQLADDEGYLILILAVFIVALPGP